jgi:hypothetical protein
VAPYELPSASCSFLSNHEVVWRMTAYETHLPQNLQGKAACSSSARLCSDATIPSESRGLPATHLMRDGRGPMATLLSHGRARSMHLKGRRR